MTTGTTDTTGNAADRTFTVSRVFDAPRDLVFRAFTEPERISRWWGPRDWQTTTVAMDVRPGGVWHYVMRGPDGTESWGKTTYREIVPPERIVSVDAFSDAEGNVAPGMPEMLITLRFEDVGGKTRLTSDTLFPSAEELKSIKEMGMEEGLAETWDRLAEYLAQA